MDRYIAARNAQRDADRENEVARTFGPRSVSPSPRRGAPLRLKWRARTLSALSIQSAICTVMLIVLLYALCPHASGADSEMRRYCAPPQFVYAAFVLDNLLRPLLQWLWK